MAMTYEEYHGLVEALLAHPEWRAELRPLILGEELMALPRGQQRSDDRLDRVEDLLRQSAERQDRTDAQIAANSAQIAALAERQDRNDAQITALIQGLDRVDAQIAELTARMVDVEQRLLVVEARLGRVEHRLGGIEGRMGNIEGAMLEARYERNLPGLLYRLVRRAKAVTAGDLPALTAALANGVISQDEFDRVLELDFLVAGELSGGRAGVAALEVSATINVDDVSRALTRAAVLRKAGIETLAIVGGYGIRDDARVLAEAAGVELDVRRPPASFERAPGEFDDQSA